MEKQVKSVATVLLIPYDAGTAQSSRIDDEHEEHKEGEIEGIAEEHVANTRYKGGKR